MSDNALKVIVHADDFGLSEKINEGILQAHLHGILTSTSIMANGEAFEHAVALARSTPTLDVGIHLTLIEESPLLHPAKIPTLLESNGRFYRHAFRFGRKYFAGKINLNEVKEELETQIQKVLAAGLTLSHLDSHQHVHMLPGVLKIVLALSRKYGIPAIRLPREAVTFGKIIRVPFMRILQALALNFFCQMAINRIERRTDCFAGFLYGGHLNKENLLKIFKYLSCGDTCEIMCHPGLEDSRSRYAHWQYHWLDELNALVNNEIRQFVRGKGIQLISYCELGTSSSVKAQEQEPWTNSI